MKGRMNRLRGYFSGNDCCEKGQHRAVEAHCHRHRGRSRHNIKILSDMPTGFTGTIENVIYDKRAILQKIIAMGLTIGCQIKVKNHGTCCGCVIIEVKNSKVVLSNTIANAIAVSSN